MSMYPTYWLIFEMHCINNALMIITVSEEGARLAWKKVKWSLSQYLEKYREFFEKYYLEVEAIKVVKIASQLANSYEFASWLRKPGWTGRKIEPGQTRSKSGWLVKSDRIDPILRSKIFIILKPNFALIYLINSYICTQKNLPSYFS